LPRAEDGLAGADALGIANVRRLTQLGLPVYCAAPHGDELAFTFDDGPGPYTYLALRQLSRAGERATFFVVGRSIDYFPGRLQRETVVAAIGDHTYQHLVLTELAPSAIRFQLAQTKEAIERATRQPTYFFRPPYGARDATVDATAKRLGLLEILWSVDSRDSLGANRAGIIRNVEAGLRPGAIILMHENRGQTIRALSTLLPELRRRHLRSVSLLQLFASDPPSVVQVRRGDAACGVRGQLSTGS
jgi:peptidoglycan/xylan/chitin deacetylase (PgdA/CDA1 family)